MATQLRRYEVTEGGMDRVVEVWKSIAAVRRQYGFTVEFAYVDRKRNEFVWAVSHPDWEKASAIYDHSPERAAIFADGLPPIDRATITMVEPVE